MKTAVIALGGNALQPPKEKWSYDELIKNINKTIKHLKNISRIYKLFHDYFLRYLKIFKVDRCRKTPGGNNTRKKES